MSLQSSRQQQRSSYNLLSLAWGVAAAAIGGSSGGIVSVQGASDTTTNSTQTTTTTTTCQNNQYGASKDNGCSIEKPICVNVDGIEPPIGQSGDHCAPCVAYTDHPGLPDWGCSIEEPLCVTVTSGASDASDRASDTAQYTPNQKEGIKCMPYPCYNTKIVGQDDGIDYGCSQEKPFCVDGLGQDPPIGKPGMECVGPDNEEEEVVVVLEKEGERRRGWGLLKRQKQRNHKPTFLSREGGKTETKKLSYKSMSLCTGCPLSGQGRTCEATKACDTLGGAITNW